MRIRRALVVIMAITGTLMSGTAAAAKPAKPSVTVFVDKSAIFGKSNYNAGATHEQYSFDLWGDADAVSNGRALLAAGNGAQNQHIMGWGANNPEPSPGLYDWASLDARVQLMRATGASPKMITLCCSPDWMKGGAPGTTDWSRIEEAPLPEHYQDFANLAATVAVRYPDVTHFQVWNEMKGFYRADLNRWHYENYTTLYNLVYDAVKAVRPDAKIGGPYVVMDSWGGPQSHPSSLSGPWGTIDQRALDVITYWNANKHGADFVTVDGANNNKDGIWLTDGYGGCAKFSTVMSWLRGQTSLPIFWAEWYAYYGPSATLQQHTSAMAVCHAEMVRLGTNAALIWGPQGDQYGAAHPVGLVTDTRLSGGGQPTVYYPVHRGLRDFFSEPTTLYHVSVSSNTVDALAGATHTMLVNKTQTALTVSVNRTTYSLGQYEVKFVPTP